MARRANQEGSIIKRSDNRWGACLSIDGKRQWVYGPTRQAVAEKLRQLQGLAKLAGRLPDAGKLTIGDFLGLWLEQATDRLRPKTLDNYRTLVKRFILPRLGTTRLTKVNGLAVATFLRGLAKDGVSGFRARQVYALLHRALGDAVRWGLLASNPAATVERPRPRAAKRHIWSADEAMAFVRGIETTEVGRWGDLFILLVAAG